MAGTFEDLLADPVHLHRQPVTHGGENRAVDADAGLFHAQEDGDEREVDGVVDGGQRRGRPDQAESFLRPRARLAAITLRPPTVAERARKP